MSTPLAENILSLPATFARMEPDALYAEVLSLHKRMRVTRRRMCHLIQKGLLSGHCTRYRGTLYTDASRRERIPINHAMYYSLFNANLIEERTELLYGVMVGKVRQTHRNAYTRHLVYDWLGETFDFWQVQQRAPIDISAGNGGISETEPALVLLRKDACDYHVSHPPANEVLLLVEIADSSLQRDGSIKRQLYANSEIQEYWIVHIAAHSIIVHREPENGNYKSVVTYTAEQMISCLAKPDDIKRVEELIAPATTETVQNTQQ